MPTAHKAYMIVKPQNIAKLWKVYQGMQFY